MPAAASDSMPPAGPARGGPGFQQPLEVGIQGSNADRDRAQPLRSHVGKDIDIPVTSAPLVMMATGWRWRCSTPATVG